MSEEKSPPNPLRALILTPGDYREQLRAKHPVLKDSQLLITPGITIVLEAVREALNGRKSGICVVGEPDFGKTSLSKVVAQVMRKEYPGMPVYRLTAKRHDGFNEKMQWTDVAGAMGLTLAHTAQLIMQDIVTEIRTSALANEDAIALIIIDEGQTWWTGQWKYMKGLCNELADPEEESEQDPVRLVPLTLGQPEITSVVASITALHNHGRDLIKRFFTPTIELKGIRTQADLVSLLQQYDDPRFTNYPAGSDVCYTEFWLPLAFAGGWRLVKASVAFWAALKSDHATGFSSTLGFPLDRVFLSLKRFLITASKLDSADFSSTPEMWKAAVTGRKQGGAAA